MAWLRLCLATYLWKQWMRKIQSQNILHRQGRQRAGTVPGPWLEEGPVPKPVQSGGLPFPALSLRNSVAGLPEDLLSTSPIVRMIKTRPREGVGLAQGHTVCKCCDPVLSSGILPQPLLQ